MSIELHPRADLWALAAIVAVEYGIETNNMKCDDPDSVVGQCHHMQGSNWHTPEHAKYDFEMSLSILMPQQN